jgi:transcriptional regulator with XRE-family HTH domain
MFGKRRLLRRVADPRSTEHLAFGVELREARTSLGLSQEQLAQKADLDRTYVSGIERGERNPSLTNLLRLADALDTTLAALMRRARL